MSAIAPPASSDADLVVLARAGDRDAFQKLFDRHAAQVVSACRQRLRSASDVDDAVQEAFVRALANLDQLRDPSRFGPWVRSIAVRACLDHHRAARRLVAFESHEPVELEDHGPRPDELLETAELQASLRASLAQLGDRDRRALWLRHISEAPVSAVARELGVTEGSARVMLTRARQRLRAAASGLAGMFPLSWRTWVRDHLSVPNAALEGLAFALAVGVSIGAASAPPANAGPLEPQAPPPTAPTIDVAPDPGPAHDHPVTGAPRPSGAAIRGQPPDRGPLRLGNSVTVDDEYPEDADELFDVTVFSGEEETGFRMYYSELGPVGEVLDDTVQALLR